MSHNFENLKAHIVSMSVAKTWDAARLEWVVDDFELPGYRAVCPCEHDPIFEKCHLRNVKNGACTYVGNVCVKRFVPGASKLLGAVGRVIRARGRANEALTRFARSKGWINRWELSFLLDTMRRRRLTDRQAAKRREIDAAIAARLSR